MAARPCIYSEVYVLKLTKIQKDTLKKLSTRKIRVAEFVRKAIADKIKKDYAELQEKTDIYCPF